MEINQNPPQRIMPPRPDKNRVTPGKRDGGHPASYLQRVGAFAAAAQTRQKRENPLLCA